MPTFSVRVPPEAAHRFDAASAGEGGRSAHLRRLILDTGGGAGAFGLPPGRRDGARYMVRLRREDAAAVQRGAAEMALTPSGWIAALVSRHAAGRPRFPADQAATLLAVLGEVHRIGVNVNQIARALNTEVLEGRVLELEVAAVEDFRRELRAHLEGLRAAFEGNLAYWDVDR